MIKTSIVTVFSLVALLSTSFASEISYESLPSANLVVRTAGAPDSPAVVEAHTQQRKAALEQLKAHVENELGRQAIGPRCEAPTVIFAGPARGVESVCSVKFL